jgi:hypothetical protein
MRNFYVSVETAGRNRVLTALNFRTSSVFRYPPQNVTLPKRYGICSIDMSGGREAP